MEVLFLSPANKLWPVLYFLVAEIPNSIQFIVYSPISQITNLPQRALQSVHIRHPWPLTSHRIRKNSPPQKNSFSTPNLSKANIWSLARCLKLTPCPPSGVRLGRVREGKPLSTRHMCVSSNCKCRFPSILGSLKSRFVLQVAPF